MANKKSTDSLTRRKADEPRQESYVLEDVSQLEAVVSPLRRKLSRVLSAIGPATVKQLAEKMGRTPESLYYHIRALEKVGLILEVGKQEAVRKPEALYDSIAEHVIAPRQLDGDPRWQDILEKIVLTDSRMMATLYNNARRKEETMIDGIGRQINGMQSEVRLSKAALRRINRRIEETMRFIDEEGRKGNGDIYHFMFLQAPLPQAGAENY